MKILISCGEPSGDLYAGALARELRTLEPSAQVYGLGGPHLREGGGDLVEDYRGLTVTGLTEAVAVLPRSFAIYRRLVRLAQSAPPDVFVPIDFPDFNFRLAGALHRLRVPVVYYVCPQVWAWRRGRLRTIKRFAQRALVIFPFEEEIYRRSGIPVEFVGHPLLDLCRTSVADAHTKDDIAAGPRDSGIPTVALLPGSRPNEIRAILPTLLQAMAIIGKRVDPIRFVVARAPHLDDALFAAVPDQAGMEPPVTVVESRTDEVLAAADVVVTASGTATVQAAIHGRPMVIVYRLSPLTYHVVRTFAHVDAIGMVNVIAGETIVPELLQDAFTPEAVSDEVVGFLRDPARADRARVALGRVREQLGAPGATRRAAEAVLEQARAAKALRVG